MKTEVERLIERVRGDPAYVSFLLIERPYIRSALLARGTPLDDRDRTMSYPSTIGSGLHDDLIELEMWLDAIAPQDRDLLLSWSLREEMPPTFGRAAIRRVRQLVKQHAGKQEENGKATS